MPSSTAISGHSPWPAARSATPCCCSGSGSPRGWFSRYGIWPASISEKSHMSDPTADPTPRLLELAGDLVARARKLGADVAEASARTGWELSAKVRLGKTELVEEAGHHGVSLRVIRGGRVATTSTSDLTARGIERCVADALELCAHSEPDEFAGPAAQELLSQPPHPELELFDASIDSIDAERAIMQARLAEQAALGADPRITLSEG